MADFPASAVTPGQAESRTAYQQLTEAAEKPAWWLDYLKIRAEFPHFKNWRIWVYIAWASMPQPEPETEADLAREVLGCTDRSIRNWKQRDWGEEPTLDEAITWAQAGPLLQARPGIFKALAEVAVMADPKAHQDRKLALEMLGDYTPRQKQEVSMDLPQLAPQLDDLIEKAYGDDSE